MRRAITFAASAALLLITSAAGAQPTDAEKRTAAEAIYAQASELMARSDFNTACPKLEEVVQLQPNGIGAKISLADCYAGAGKLASAHAMYGQAASMASLAGQQDRAAAAQESGRSPPDAEWSSPERGDHESDIGTGEYASMALPLWGRRSRREHAAAARFREAGPQRPLRAGNTNVPTIMNAEKAADMLHT